MLRIKKRRNEKRAASRAAAPFSPISALTQKESAAVVDPESIRGLIVPFLDAHKEPQYDLMEVNISIYNLNGILSSTEKGKQKKGRNKKKGKEKKNKKSLYSWSSATDPRSPANRDTTSKVTTVRVDSGGENIDILPGDGIPTTAVVSCRRHAVGSGSSMETFLPSSPLMTVSAVGTDCHRHKASWMREEEWREVTDTEPCTFKIIRAMKRENYRPNQKIEELCNYSHETVDLQILLGHGKDMIPIGATSLVVTGDEEGEVMLNLPVKTGSGSQHKAFVDGKRSRKKKGCSKPAFSHDPSTRFSLDENARLRIGIRVSPYKDSLPTETGESGNRQALDLDENNIVIELDDENSLIARYLKEEKTSSSGRKGRKGDNEDIRQALESGCAMIGRTLSPSVQEAGYCNNPWKIFADSLSFWEADNKEKKYKQDSQLSSKNSTTQEAGLLPTFLLSSVSESTDCTPEEQTPTTADQSSKKHKKKLTPACEDQKQNIPSLRSSGNKRAEVNQPLSTVKEEEETIQASVECEENRLSSRKSSKSTEESTEEDQQLSTVKEEEEEEEETRRNTRPRLERAEL